MLCYVMLRYVTLRNVMLCYVMLCRHVMLCYAMLCYVMLCYRYVMLGNVMLCYVTSQSISICNIECRQIKHVKYRGPLLTHLKNTRHCHAVGYVL